MVLLPGRVYDCVCELVLELLRTAFDVLVKLFWVFAEVLLLSVSTALEFADFVVTLPLVIPVVELFLRLDAEFDTRPSELILPLLLLRATGLVAILVVFLLPLPSFRITFVPVDLLFP